ncbi:hypothetical protein SS05631_c06790 [Sinorhizobium sp. CCBAU 05631]|nr:hypothetical protein SS05631_c06790 [Sinorhizobium sp. CCBAU 05631]
MLVIFNLSPGDEHERYLVIEPDFQAKRKGKSMWIFID